VISSLSINSGRLSPQKIYLEVDADKASQIILPSGRILNSTAGIINYNYTGKGGNVALVVPKNTDRFRTASTGDTILGKFGGGLTINSPLIKKLRVNNGNYTSIIALNATEIVCYFNLGLSNLIAPKATFIQASNCALPLSNIKSILDNAYVLWIANIDIVVNINLGGGANAAINLADISAVHGVSYSQIRSALALDGTITLNIA
jgi:hypothetical protein